MRIGPREIVAPQSSSRPATPAATVLPFLPCQTSIPAEPASPFVINNCRITFVACEGTESAAFNRSLSTTAVPVPCDDPLCRSSCSDSGGCCDAAQV